MRGESGRGPALSISLWVSWDFWSLLAPECSAGAMVLFSCGRAVMGCDLDPNRRAMGNRIVYSPSAQTKRDALRRETYCGRMTRLVGLGEWGSKSSERRCGLCPCFTTIADAASYEQCSSRLRSDATEGTIFSAPASHHRRRGRSGVCGTRLIDTVLPVLSESRGGYDSRVGRARR
jgi:hypothetical protein